MGLGDAASIAGAVSSTVNRPVRTAAFGGNVWFVILVLLSTVEVLIGDSSITYTVSNMTYCSDAIDDFDQYIWYYFHFSVRRLTIVANQ